MPYSLGLFADVLPKSRFYVDWFRETHFLNSTRQLYLNKESLMKASVVAANTALGFLAAHLNQEEQSACSDISVGLTTVLLGLSLSQLANFGWFLKKRYEFQQECIHLVVSINLSLENRQPALSAETKKSIRETIDVILKSTQLEENPFRLTQALEQRKLLLTQVQGQVANSMQDKIMESAANFGLFEK